MKDKLTVIVNSCDNYADAWEPFFYLYKQNWKQGSKLDIILNTETKSFSYSGLNIKACNTNSKNWGERFLKALNQIKTEYVLVLLDDIFFEDVVRDDIIKKFIAIMDNDKNIACINMQKPCFGENIKTDYEFLERRKNGDEYTVSCQPGIWRVKKLKKLINKNYSPWQFEIYGSLRTSLYPNWKFFIMNNNSPRVIGCNWYGVDGCGIHSGKWQNGTPELFEKYGIEMDFSIRGFVGEKLNFGAVTKPKRDFNDTRILIQNYIKVLKKKVGFKR